MGQLLEQSGFHPARKQVTMRIRCPIAFAVAAGLVAMPARFLAAPSPVAAFSVPSAAPKFDRRFGIEPVRLPPCAKEPATSSSGDGGSPDRQRRRAVSGVANAILAAALIPGAVGAGPAVAQAAGYVPGTVWRTGKPPEAPGQTKPRDKGDTKGTRRDAGFLRSIADCKAQCERSSGADGLARSKEDCLSECQDVCCETYEQCTFAIVPRI